VNFLKRLSQSFGQSPLPLNLRIGQFGEHAAERYLKQLGYKLLATNFRAGKGEIDLVFRDGDVLVFVEVKTRSSEEWGRPVTAVDREKRRIISKTALAYLRLLGNPPVRFRFDVVEVLLDGQTVREVRHIPNCFTLPEHMRYFHRPPNNP